MRHFFDWLETKAYKMHIRVLLSRYRSYTECPACHGARLKPEALLWRLRRREDVGVRREEPHANRQRTSSEEGLLLLALPLTNCDQRAARPAHRRRGRLRRRAGLPAPLDEATELLLDEIRGRLRYLLDVGLGYLTLDRQCRTLSGGEVQRINLTTALGTSLVNTLFVLDEPSIGLHPRDMDRINQAMARLRDAGNTLVVVEHDPAVMLAADRMIDIGPGPGSAGGAHRLRRHAHRPSPTTPTP